MYLASRDVARNSAETIIMHSGTTGTWNVIDGTTSGGELCINIMMEGTFIA